MGVYANNKNHKGSKGAQRTHMVFADKCNHGGEQAEGIAHVAVLLSKDSSA